jgi:hypothetical protein
MQQQQSAINTLISRLENRLTVIFPAAEISFDGQNLTASFERSDALNGEFVLLLFDLTCMEDAESGSVAVHARPDHIFEPHWVIENERRTLVLENQQRFTDGDFTDDGEFPDGHGNSMWIFNFPNDEERIADLFCGLAKISSDYFA